MDKLNCYVTKLDINDASRAVCVDDTILTTGMYSTASSKMLANFTAPFEATVISRLREDGYEFAGKTNTGEFGMDITTESSFFGPTINHLSEKRISGGAATAVAIGDANYGLCVDSDGSARRYASFSGVSFIKPTYGTVSRYGVIASVSSSEQVGVCARTTREAAKLLSVIAGHDCNDGTSLPAERYTYDIVDVKGMKVGVPVQLFEGLTDDAKKLTSGFIKKLETLGIKCEEFTLACADYASDAYHIISSAEACNNYSRFDGIKFGYRAENCEGLEDIYIKSRSEAFSLNTKKIVLMGSLSLSKAFYEKFYLKALKIRRLVREEMTEAFKKYDAVLSPVSAGSAYPLGYALDNDEARISERKYTAVASIIGIPSVVTQCGLDPDGMPIGIQLMGDSLCDSKIISIAAAYEDSGR
ncbi:MAG: Asp-tRNA(Asn)/Glu-tRNA(Gln) amidotransferase subunit GatA [Clostridiales bacterium]|nr:Asp-tRNA(Asn)/Glu-tRNA(Gln) amidotransferase subunit GatA [Clostridiales bacterium]